MAHIFGPLLAASARFAPGGAGDPFSLPYDHFLEDTLISGVTTYRIAQLAKAGFDKLPASDSKVFIGTGNLTPWGLYPQLLGLSAGKRVLANIIEVGAQAYGPANQR